MAPPWVLPAFYTAEGLWNEYDMADIAHWPILETSGRGNKKRAYSINTFFGSFPFGVSNRMAFRQRMSGNEY